jgi:hypothetical protein
MPRPGCGNILGALFFIASLRSAKGILKHEGRAAPALHALESYAGSAPRFIEVFIYLNHWQ